MLVVHWWSLYCWNFGFRWFVPREQYLSGFSPASLQGLRDRSIFSCHGGGLPAQMSFSWIIYLFIYYFFNHFYYLFLFFSFLFFLLLLAPAWIFFSFHFAMVEESARFHVALIDSKMREKLLIIDFVYSIWMADWGLNLWSWTALLNVWSRGYALKLHWICSGVALVLSCSHRGSAPNSSGTIFLKKCS